MTETQTFGNPPIPVEDVTDAEGNTYCQVHPERETGLRCNNCGRLMCATCAVSTPVGYRCKECVRERESSFFNADTAYYVRLFAVCAGLGGLGALVASWLNWFIFAFIIGAVAGSIISEGALRVTKGKRGRYAAQVAVAGIIVGTVAVLFLSALPYISYIQSQSLSPEQLNALAQQYGAERAQAFAQQIRQEQTGLIFRLLGGSLMNISVWLYAGIAAVTVYGRFNIYGSKR